MAFVSPRRVCAVVLAAILSIVQAATVSISTTTSSQITIPTPYSVQPSGQWDGNDGPWSSFPLVVGSGAALQNIRVFVSTAANNILTVYPDACSSSYIVDCETRRGGVFNATLSPTWTPAFSSFYTTFVIDRESNLALEEVGRAGYDNIILGRDGSNRPLVNQTTIYSMFFETYWLGVLGLNPTATTFVDYNITRKSWMQTLFDTRQIPSVSYGYTAGNQYRLDKVLGSLTLGGYDENRFTGFNDAVSWTFNRNPLRDMMVTIKSIASESGTALLPYGSISAFVDSTVPTMWLPVSACEAFEREFGLTYNYSHEYYLLDDKTHASLVARNPSVAITLTNGKKDVTITLPYAAFNLTVSEPIVQGTQYYFPLSRAYNDRQYTLGRVFLQEAYLIADYGQRNFTIAPCSWDAARVSSTSIKTIPAASYNPRPPVETDAPQDHLVFDIGGLVGMVVGIVAFVLIVSGACCCCFRRRRNKTKAAHDVEPAAVAVVSQDGKHAGKVEVQVLADEKEPKTSTTELHGDVVASSDTSPAAASPR